MKQLNTLLANVAIMAQKTHNLHWNVHGPCFMAYHKFTDEIYLELNKFIDEIAEKIAMQGELPLSSCASYIKHANIKELEAKKFTTKEVVEILLVDFTILKESVMAVPTAETVQPLLDDILMFLDKYQWFIKASV